MTNKHFRFSILDSRFSTRPRTRGQALVEYALVFPLQLMMTLAIIQLAHLFVAKHVLDYAAFCGARACLVGLSEFEAERAACTPITRIAGPSGVGGISEDPIEVPGWGELPGWQAAFAKTLPRYGYGDFDLEEATVLDAPAIRCDLTHMYELRVPIGNIVAYSIGDVFLAADELVKIGGAPHVRLKATCTLAQPWREE